MTAQGIGVTLIFQRLWQCRGLDVGRRYMKEDKHFVCMPTDAFEPSSCSRTYLQIGGQKERGLCPLSLALYLFASPGLSKPVSDRSDEAFLLLRERSRAGRARVGRG